MQAATSSLHTDMVTWRWCACSVIWVQNRNPANGVRCTQLTAAEWGGCSVCGVCWSGSGSVPPCDAWRVKQGKHVFASVLTKQHYDYIITTEDTLNQYVRCGSCLGVAHLTVMWCHLMMMMMMISQKAETSVGQLDHELGWKSQVRSDF